MFNASEVFQVAVRIEENGAKFYRQTAQTTQDEAIKKTFTYLADEEVNHKKTFEEMQSQIDQYEPPETYPGEYLAYFKAFVDNAIFSQQQPLPDNPRFVLDFAIAQELNSILYYHEVKRFVPRNQEHQVDQIIDEERKHFIKLLGLRENFITERMDKK